MLLDIGYHNDPITTYGCACEFWFLLLIVTFIFVYARTYVYPYHFLIHSHWCVHARACTHSHTPINFRTHNYKVIYAYIKINIEYVAFD